MIEGLHFVKIRRSRRPLIWYVYAWRGGPRIMCVESACKPKLSNAALALLHVANEARQQVKQHTIAGLVRVWRRSPEWAQLADSTRKTWSSQLTAIEKKWGLTPLALWNDPRMVRKIMEWRDSRSSTPRAADLGVMVLRTLLEFGRLQASVTINVAVSIPTLYRGAQRAEIIWTDDDIAAFEGKANELGQPHIIDGLRLAALTGLRRSDLVTLTWDHIGDEVLRKLALKSSRRRRRHVTIPRIAELDALLEQLRGRHRAPGVNTVLVNSFGHPWSADGFGGSFNRIRDAASVVHVDPDTGERRAKHLHDVRGTFATKLVEAGLTDQQVADMMGWSPKQVADIRRVYVDHQRVVVAIARSIGSGCVKGAVK